MFELHNPSGTAYAYANLDFHAYVTDKQTEDFAVQRVGDHKVTTRPSGAILQVLLLPSHAPATMSGLSVRELFPNYDSEL